MPYTRASTSIYGEKITLSCALIYAIIIIWFKLFLDHQAGGLQRFPHPQLLAGSFTISIPPPVHSKIIMCFHMNIGRSYAPASRYGIVWRLPTRKASVTWGHLVILAYRGAKELTWLHNE